MATSSIDFTVSPPTYAVQGTITGVAAQTVAAHFTGPAHELRGMLNGQVALQTRGLSREELAQNLTGRVQIASEDLSFGSFDPLGTLAETSHWGKLEPVRGPAATAPADLSLELSDRRIFLNPTSVDFSGAVLHLQGSYAWSGAVDLSVRADMRRLRRHWLMRDEDVQLTDALPVVHLTGTVGHLEVTAPVDDVTASKVRSGGIR
jgi:hypothetical protein